MRSHKAIGKAGDLYINPARRHIHVLAFMVVSAVCFVFPLVVHAEVAIPRSKGGSRIAPVFENSGVSPSQPAITASAERRVAEPNDEPVADINITIVMNESGSITQHRVETPSITQSFAAGSGNIVLRIDAHRLSLGLEERNRDLEPFILAKLDALHSRENIEAWLRYTPPATFDTAQISSSLSDRAEERSVYVQADQQSSEAPVSSSRMQSQRTVTTFISAVRRRDTKAIARLLHPTQFAGLDLRGGGESALLAAAKLVMHTFKPTSVDIRAVRSIASDQSSPSFWTVDTQTGQKTIELKQVGDVMYIVAIS